MTSEISLGRNLDLATVLAVRRVGVDDCSDVRYVHIAALRAYAADALAGDEIEALIGSVRLPDYATELLHRDFYGGWIGGRLAATGGWHPAGDAARTARIQSLFVDPLYARSGIGRRMLTEIECRAAAAGYQRLTVRATANAVPFYERHGYRIAAQGMHHFGPPLPSIPVTYLRKVAVQTVLSPEDAAQTEEQPPLKTAGS